MGTQYYLIRRDNHTLYELGKVRAWGPLFASGLPTPEALVGITRWADTVYAERLLAHITAWLDGHPVEFIDALRLPG